MNRVVVIEDNSTIRKLLDALLTGEGYEVVTCQTSAGAYDCVRRAAPDAVIVNPATHSGGWHVLGALEADRQLRETPVVVCTADKHALRREATLRREANAMREKPFDIDELLTVLGRAMARA